MATSLEEPPGNNSSESSVRAKSYAALLRSNLPSVSNKNVIEISLEKDFKGPFNVSVEDCAKVLVKLGIDPQPSVYVESVQICPNGRGVVYVTLKPDEPIERFCLYDVIQVTESGIRAVQIKPAGKRDIIVTLKGIHPNTRDDGVMDYLSKFGKLTSTKVVRPVFGEGPLKGLGNGDRMFKLELSPNKYLGTYHVIDGQRVIAKYRGQQPTCARCFCTPQTCPGKGMARKCEIEGGVKLEFNDYIFNLWEEIGYEPSNVDLGPENNIEHATNACENFTPVKTTSLDSEKYFGVRISSFPKDIDHGQIVEFLVNSGLPGLYMDHISIRHNGSVLIQDLPNNVCLDLITAINDKLSFGRKLYCNGVIPRTPDKPANDQTQDQQEVVNSVSSQENEQEQSKLSHVDNNSIEVPTLLSPMSPNTFSQQYSETPDMNLQLLSNVELARRNSLSLRTPPTGSLGDELLKADSQHITKFKSIVSNIKDMAEKFSDFGTCESLSDETDTDRQTNEKFQLQGRKKKRKIKLSPSPPTEYFLKKPNVRQSPDNLAQSSPVNLVKGKTVSRE